MSCDTRAFISASSVCAHSESSHQPLVGQLRPLPAPTRPWSHIAVDFITGHPPSNGNTTILTIFNHFSKVLRVTTHSLRTSWSFIFSGSMEFLWTLSWTVDLSFHHSFLSSFGCSYQPVFWLLSPQYPSDRAGQPEPQVHFTMCHRTSPCLLEHPPVLDRICRKFSHQLCYRYVRWPLFPSSLLRKRKFLSHLCRLISAGAAAYGRLHLLRSSTGAQPPITSLDRRFGFLLVLSPCKLNLVSWLHATLDHLKLRE